jgi:hypothetical protein
MSKAAFGSDWVSMERNTTLFRDPLNKDRRFVPVLLENCTIRDTLRRFKYVDYRRESAKAFDQLLKVCRSEAVTPPAQPLAQLPHLGSDFRFFLTVGGAGNAALAVDNAVSQGGMVNIVTN